MTHEQEPSRPVGLEQRSRLPWLWGGVVALVVAGGIVGVAVAATSEDSPPVETVAGQGAEGDLAPQEEPTSATAEGEGNTGSTKATEALLAKGSFVAEDYLVRGRAAVTKTANGTVLRLSQFRADGGPDLRIFVVPEGSKYKEGVDVGSLQANQGNQEYLLPSSLNAADIQGSTVVVWCYKFSVAFGSAQL